MKLWRWLFGEEAIRTEWVKQRLAARLAAAEKWLAQNDNCPHCHTTGGDLYTYQDGMDVNIRYCHDPLYWHAAQMRHGTYGNVTRDEALLAIGKRLVG